MKYILNNKYLILMVFLFSGCAQLPPTPQDIQAKRFDAVAGRAVIYVVRPAVDSPTAGPLSISGAGMISTHAGTYFRWETAPGAQQIAGVGASSATLTVQAEAGKIYFVEHTVIGNIRDGIQSMSLRQIDENRGRRMVSAAQLL